MVWGQEGNENVIKSKKKTMKVKGRNEVKSESEKKLGNERGTREKVKGLPGKCQACFLSHRPAFKCGERGKLLKHEKVRHFCFMKPPKSKNAKHLCSYDHNEYLFFKMSDIFFQKFPLRQS